MMIIAISGNCPNICNTININIVRILKSNEKKTSLVNRVGQRYEGDNSEEARKYMKIISIQKDANWKSSRVVPLFSWQMNRNGKGCNLQSCRRDWVGGCHQQSLREDCWQTYPEI